MKPIHVKKSKELDETTSMRMIAKTLVSAAEHNVGRKPVGDQGDRDGDGQRLYSRSGGGHWTF